MKITIEPSYGTYRVGYPTVSIDTNTNEELTPDVFEAAIKALEMAGHSRCNLVFAAHEFAEINKPK